MTEDYPTKRHIKEWNDYANRLQDKIALEQDKTKKGYFQYRLKTVKGMIPQ